MSYNIIELGVSIEAQRLDVKIMIKKCNYVIMFRNFNVDLI